MWHGFKFHLGLLLIQSLSFPVYATESTAGHPQASPTSAEGTVFFRCFDGAYVESIGTEMAPGGSAEQRNSQGFIEVGLVWMTPDKKRDILIIYSKLTADAGTLYVLDKALQKKSGLSVCTTNKEQTQMIADALKNPLAHRGLRHEFHDIRIRSLTLPWIR